MATNNDTTDTTIDDLLADSRVRTHPLGTCAACGEPLRFCPCLNCGHPNRDVEVADE